MNLSRYRKAIVAVIGLAIVALNEFFGADIGLGEVDEIINIGAMFGTTLGVFQVRNEEV